MAQTQKLLEIQNVSKIFRIGGMLMGKKLTAIDDVSLDIDAGKPVILSIVGESGCGKSTLCKMILQAVQAGHGGHPAAGQLVRRQEGVQSPSSSGSTCSRSSRTRTSRSPRARRWTPTCSTPRCGWASARDRAEAEKVVDETLRSVGMSLAVVKDKYPTQFSGGELQRVSIARALITRPKLIIADEPVAAIDASMKMNIVNLFKELKDQVQRFVHLHHPRPLYGVLRLGLHRHALPRRTDRVRSRPRRSWTTPRIRTPSF